MATTDPATHNYSVLLAYWSTTLARILEELIRQVAPQCTITKVELPCADLATAFACSTWDIVALQDSPSPRDMEAFAAVASRSHAASRAWIALVTTEAPDEARAADLHQWLDMVIPLDGITKYAPDIRTAIADHLARRRVHLDHARATRWSRPIPKLPHSALTPPAPTSTRGAPKSRPLVLLTAGPSTSTPWCRRHLEDAGYAVHLAPSEEEILSALNDQALTYRALVIDTEMPDGDPADLLRLIRLIEIYGGENKLPVVVYAAQGTVPFDILEDAHTAIHRFDPTSAPLAGTLARILK